MDTPPGVYRCLADTIAARLRLLSVEPPEDDNERPRTVEIEAERVRLGADQATVQLHSEVTDQPVTYGHTSFCRECGEPAPCETIRRLSEQYGCEGEPS
jgi:hypothetical protein